jgi:hypothetical protein
MLRMRVMGLCLAAALSAGALAATSASALPEFSSPFSKTFTAKSAGSLFETVSGKKTKCTADTVTGEVTGPQSGTINFVFTGCAFAKTPCNTPGAAPGVIATGPLEWRIGYINKANKEVGMDIFEPFGGPFASYGCGSATFVKVTGSVIGRLTPINKKVIPAKVFKLKFKQTTGKQEVPALEASPIDILESSFGGPPEATGLKSTEAILFGEPVLLSA